MTETTPAVVLAGGRKSDEVAEAWGLPHKALVPVCGKPAIRWVVEALQGAELVGEVVVVTELEEVAQALPEGVAVVRPAGGSMLDTVTAGLQHFPEAERIIACTSDLPLLTPAAVDDFTRRSLDSGAELCYSVVREHRLWADAAGCRTFVHLRDGDVSGGNLFYFSRRFLEQEGPRVNAAFAGRKSPVKLAALLGIGFIWGMLWRSLTIPQLVKKAERIMGVSVAVVDSEYPEVCFDIDEIAHVAVAEEALRGNGK